MDADFTKENKHYYRRKNEYGEFSIAIWNETGPDGTLARSFEYTYPDERDNVTLAMTEVLDDMTPFAEWDPITLSIALEELMNYKVEEWKNAKAA